MKKAISYEEAIQNGIEEINMPSATNDGADYLIEAIEINSEYYSELTQYEYSWFINQTAIKSEYANNWGAYVYHNWIVVYGCEQSDLERGLFEIVMLMDYFETEF